MLLVVPCRSTRSRSSLITSSVISASCIFSQSLFSRNRFAWMIPSLLISCSTFPSLSSGNFSVFRFTLVYLQLIFRNSSCPSSTSILQHIVLQCPDMILSLPSTSSIRTSCITPNKRIEFFNPCSFSGSVE